MIKKAITVASAGFLILGLAACNNNDNDNNRNNVMDHGTGAYNVRDNDRNNDRVGMDHEGLLTEEFTPGHKDDRNDRFGTFGNDNDHNNRRGMKNWRNWADISSVETDMSSSQYPQTRAVLIQQAKYKFIRISPEQARQLQQQLQSGQLIALPPNFGATPPMTGRNEQPLPEQQAPAPQQQAPEQQQAPAPQQQQPNATAPQQQQQTAPTSGISQLAQQVIDLTNVQRQQNGLPPLKADAKLSGVALKKSQDMAQKNYFSHTSPTYGSPFDMMRDFGVTYKSAGENIAMGQRTPEEVVKAWMNSEGHRRNILNKDFTHIGVGFEQSGYHWTQMFIGK